MALQRDLWILVFATHQVVEATRARYGADLPGLDKDSEIPALIQDAVNTSSPAWQRLDTLIREQLHLDV